MTELNESKERRRETREETQSTSQNDSHQSTPSLWEEFLFLMVNEKWWWIAPVLIAIAMIVIAVAFSQSTTVPFIYRLF